VGGACLGGSVFGRRRRRDGERDAVGSHDLIISMLSGRKELGFPDALRVLVVSVYALALGRVSALRLEPSEQ
jgi:hypothetical protein